MEGMRDRTRSFIEPYSLLPSGVFLERKRIQTFQDQRKPGGVGAESRVCRATMLS